MKLGEFELMADLVRLRKKSSPSKPGIAPGSPITLLLVEGDYIEAKASDTGSGTVEVRNSAGVLVKTIAFGPKATFNVGPYRGANSALFTCTAGSIDATVGDAVLGAAQVQTDAASSSDTLVVGNRRYPLQDASRPVVLLDWDHSYEEIAGLTGADGMAAWYAKYNAPVALAINTDPTVSPAPGSGPGAMTWQQLAAVQKLGVEVISHGTKHVGNWSKINSGLTIWYKGTDASGTAQVAYSDVNNHPVGSSLALVSSAATDNATFTFGTYATLGVLSAAINANPKWGCEIDPTIDPNTPSTFLIGHLSAVALTKSLNTAVGIAVGGGILLTYTGTAYKRLTYRRQVSSNNFNLYADGVLLMGVSLTNGSYNTLLKLVNAINALAVSGLSAALCNNDGSTGSAFHNCLSGGEASTALMFHNNLEIGRAPVVIDTCYLSRAQMIRAQHKTSAANAAVNGVTLRGFAQSGGGYFPWVIPGNNGFSNHRHNPNKGVYSPAAARIRETAQPDAVTHQLIFAASIRFYYTGTGATATITMNADRVLIGAVTGPGASDSFAFDTKLAAYDDIGKIATAARAINGGVWQVFTIALSQAASPNHTPASVLSPGYGPYNAKNTIGYTGAAVPANDITKSRLKAALDALADCNGFYFRQLTHRMWYDGSSGFAGLNMGYPQEYADCSETAMEYQLSYLKSLSDAGKVQVLPASAFVKMRQAAPAPTNYVFNPNFICSPGENLRINETVAANEGGMGKLVPGWALAADAPNLSSLVRNADGSLTLTTTSVAALIPIYQQFALEPGLWCFTMDVVMSNFVAGGYVRAIIGSQTKNIPFQSPRDTASAIYSDALYESREVRIEFLVEDSMVYPLPELLGRAVEPFNLSINNQISPNIDGVGAIANVNCAAGAASASAVSAKEVAVAINAAFAASGSYPAELQAPAFAFAGRVGLRSPYRRTSEANPAITVAAGTADATAAIFGAPLVGSGTPLVYSPNSTPATAEDFMYQLSVSLNVQGTVTISNPSLTRVRGNV